MENSEFWIKSTTGINYNCVDREHFPVNFLKPLTGILIDMSLDYFCRS